MIKVITVEQRLNLQKLRCIGQSRRVYHHHSGGLGNSNGRADFKEL